MRNVAEKLEAGSVSLQDFRQQDPEFQELMLHIISIHVASEMSGADCFELSILKAPTAEFKMRMAKTVMEEYGNHLRLVLKSVAKGQSVSASVDQGRRRQSKKKNH